MATTSDSSARTDPSESGPQNEPRQRRWTRYFSFRRVSAIYLFVALVLIFSIWVPDTFLTQSTLKSILSEQAVTAILAIGLVVPLAAGAFDLSVGLTLGAANVTVEWFIVSNGVAPGLAIILTLLLGVTIGSVNGFLVTRAGISSFIATLGVSSVLSAFVVWVSGNQLIVGTSPSFANFATREFFGISASFYIMIAVAIVVWYVLAYRPSGRKVYAVGGSIETARLAGVRVRAVIFMALTTAGLIAALAGILLASQIGVGSPTVGPPYLIPAFAAVFLGSTQLQEGRFNVWGTVLAVYVLATGVKGLQLAGAPFYVSDLFNGVALILAVWLSRVERRRGNLGAQLRRRSTQTQAS